MKVFVAGATGMFAKRIGAQRSASNAKARRELGWTPKYPIWREGVAAEFD